MQRVYAAFFVSLGLTACGGGAGSGTLTCPASTKALSYATDVAPIFQDNCVRCHSQSATNRNGAPASVNVDTYANAKTSADAVAQAVQQEAMPPGGNMSDADRCTVVNWVSQGTAP